LTALTVSVLSGSYFEEDEPIRQSTIPYFFLVL